MDFIESLLNAKIENRSYNKPLTLDALLGGQPISAITTEGDKPAPEKKRIRFGTKEYFDWIRPVKKTLEKATAFIKEVMADEKKSDCPCCGGTGEYVGANYRTRCARCKGKGFLTSQDEKAYATWKSSRDRGLPRMRQDFGAAYNFA